MKKKIAKVFSFLFILSFTVCTSGKSTIYYLNDDAGLFKSNERQIINNKLSTIEKQTSLQFVVWTVESTKDKTLEEYSLEIAQTLEVGQKGINNGILMLIVFGSRKIRIEVGYGIEWILSDKKSQKIIQEIVPYFKKKDYFRGLIKGIDLIDQQISKYDWQINTINLIESLCLNGKFKDKIVCFYYANKTGKNRYKYPLPTDDQFDKDFKIDLVIDNDNIAVLYYTKYMGDFVNEIVTAKKVKIHSRVLNTSPLELQLLGVLKD